VATVSFVQRNNISLTANKKQEKKQTKPLYYFLGQEVYFGPWEGACAGTFRDALAFEYRLGGFTLDDPVIVGLCALSALLPNSRQYLLYSFLFCEIFKYLLDMLHKFSCAGIKEGRLAVFVRKSCIL